ncbi:(2Fe-2S)-binding protein [Thermosipho melanesiensis]|uniref:(2Fe-2S)-binding domain protein n=2 Tax=Thermosipho melanesiensis TaxID=46541 RepID=A6LML8_THEM4|nr:2Fe-2S iron-sulfur cluster-binding protein [Thermosipho melanesiensis]ABR31169.1 (2Fe-2S)-binding domain protein [Thermosipho melanesiensis BI429]APT74258.1 (2Fe-2S)-binding protein [Thermosipho melanesiensis]OOC36198.1 (2Fe-2S)-binding protein [Thermosipho melanesiensis]OOC37016.1 (2Fe-2S)-binding protein [Thermosipho melanesiensis]OOC37768.1 (2Fe-2S)-binding protein [Thermosipho melanesiensis]
MKITLKINGKTEEVDIKPYEILLDVLRRLGYYSVRRGCDTGMCGICTVLLDGKPVPSCSIFAAKVDGHSITTVEGLKEAKELAKLLAEEGADQCGFCSPGLIVNTIYLKNMGVKDKDEIKSKLIGNLCRCTGYVSQHRAIEKFLGVE